jgi:hypothetical protein
VQRFVLVSFWGEVVSGEGAANTAALAEACALSQPNDTPRVACIRLPRVLCARDLAPAGERSRDHDITAHDAVYAVVNVAAESSQGIFVPSWRGTLPAALVRGAMRSERAGEDWQGVEPGPSREGPMFPAEQAHSSAAPAIKRVSGPLYPANDVFRKVLSGVPARPGDAEREEWMRLMTGQLYHIVPMGTAAGTPGSRGGGS